MEEISSTIIEAAGKPTEPSLEVDYAKRMKHVIPDQALLRRHGTNIFVSSYPAQLRPGLNTLNTHESC